MAAAKRAHNFAQAYLIKGWLLSASAPAEVTEAIDQLITNLQPAQEEQPIEQVPFEVRWPNWNSGNDFVSLDKLPNVGDGKEDGFADDMNVVISTHARTGYDVAETDADEKALGKAYQQQLNERANRMVDAVKLNEKPASVSPSEHKKDSVSQSLESETQTEELPPGMKIIFGKPRVTMSDEQKREIVRRRDAGEKWPAIAKALNLPEKKCYQFHYNYSDQLDRWRSLEVHEQKDSKIQIVNQEKAVKTAIPVQRKDTPAEQLIAKHNEYVGKREPNQPLTDEDWPEIKSMLKSYGADYIAAQYQVKRTELDWFIAEQSEGEAKAPRF